MRFLALVGSMRMVAGHAVLGCAMLAGGIVFLGCTVLPADAPPPDAKPILTTAPPPEATEPTPERAVAPAPEPAPAPAPVRQAPSTGRDCPELSCDNDCPGGYLHDARGCASCLCREGGVEGRGSSSP